MKLNDLNKQVEEIYRGMEEYNNLLMRRIDYLGSNETISTDELEGVKNEEEILNGDIQIRLNKLLMDIEQESAKLKVNSKTEFYKIKLDQADEQERYVYDENKKKVENMEKLIKYNASKFEELLRIRMSVPEMVIENYKHLVEEEKRKGRSLYRKTF